MVQTPSKATLRKYGLSELEWRRLLVRQGGTCYVCEKVPSSGRLHIDHEHIKGWKKMPAERRKLYVRGLLCWFCNKNYVGRAITIRKARNVVNYLQQYASRSYAQQSATRPNKPQRSIAKENAK